MKAYLLLAICVMSAAGQTSPALLAEKPGLLLSVAGDSHFLEIKDPGNRAWMLQSSSDLKAWADGPTHRVFNGVLRVPAAGADRKQFYRLNPELAQPLPSSAARALRLPATPFNYANPVFPPVFASQVGALDNQPADNVVTNTGATLGRVLFYDKRLSANQSTSCASCHQAEHGFADTRPLSVGFAGEKTHRNSMGLTNTRYHLGGKYLWDERAASLEVQVLMPIQDPIEMGTTLPIVVERLSAEPFYAELFTAAFGTAEINSTRISRALAQFIRSISSANTKLDIAQETNFANFTPQELLGREVFSNRCSTCHSNVNFTTIAPSKNGLELPIVDKGVGGVTGLTFDDGRFKVTTLRNVELTAPYMHDGRFKTLEEVVEFYNSGVEFVDGLGFPLPFFEKTRGGMNLTQAEKDGLVAFMKTLTDTSVTTDEKFSDPFRYQAE
ncbi:cytochrome c peroxidase [Haloferula sp. BvORR071]|uniref:cytochrome-c peroxidase n=1 Tax=Haloferula sp. BvORR071 TaxID=1396141 RepID=UPI002240F007|nr:cytochrome c peroxidase [Haloferula sp. BvORR071]